ncbi:MAG: DUF3108 domain-containing protein [Bacteroidota bacterium]
MKSLRMSALLIMLVACPILAQQEAGIRPVFQSGEELQYKVKWSFFRLGTVFIRTQRDTSSVDSALYRVTMNIESNPSLFFVKVHDKNESLISIADVMSRVYFGKHCKGDGCNEIHFEYDGVHRRAFYSEKYAEKDKPMCMTIIEDASPYVDGPSLLFFARCHSGSGKVLHVPTMNGGVIRNTVLNFTGPLEEVEIGAFDQPIRTRKYTGFMDWEGGTSAGLSGEFTGWISDDEAAIPIQAEMKVILGSVHLELEKWHREGWVPPTAPVLVKN